MIDRRRTGEARAEQGARPQGEAMAEFARDPMHWLMKFSPDEWIRAALGEVFRAQAAYASGNVRGAIAGCKRAAGMAINALLIVEPNEGGGRTYVEHVVALGDDDRAPPLVRQACKLIIGMPQSRAGDSLVTLRTPSTEFKLIEASRDVIAHAWAVVKRHESTPS